VREVVHTDVVALNADASRADLRLRAHDAPHRQRLYPVVDAQDRLLGAVERRRAEDWAAETSPVHPEERFLDIALREPVVAYLDEPLRITVTRMAESGLTRFPVVERGAERRFAGMIALTDLLKARQLNLEAERRRERVLALPFRWPRSAAAASAYEKPAEAPIAPGS